MGSAAGRCALSVVAGDASNRRFFRLRDAGRTAIVMEAPPATEKNAEFLNVQQLLVQSGVRVPGVLAVDLPRGYFLLDDLGGQMLLPLLNAASVDGWYARACAVLLDFARVDACGRVPDYDRALLEEELSRLPAWFFQRLLGLAEEGRGRDAFDGVAALLVDSALAQARVFVHRDFHSRNLMVEEGGLAVIDFQDAVFGPVTYDLVSLLRDCYIRWPRDRVEAWALAHRDRLQAAGLLEPVTDEDFLRWFDLMGLQRHLKVLGTFARLYLRDGKAGYLDDLPLVIQYVEDVLTRRSPGEPALATFHAWWQERVAPVVAQQRWAAA